MAVRSAASRAISFSEIALQSARRVIRSAGLREIGPTFGPLIKAWRATAAGYSDDELRLLLEFQRRLEEIVRDQLARLRGEGDGSGGAGS